MLGTGCSSLGSGREPELIPSLCARRRTKQQMLCSIKCIIRHTLISVLSPLLGQLSSCRRWSAPPTLTNCNRWMEGHQVLEGCALLALSSRKPKLSRTLPLNSLLSPTRLPAHHQNEECEVFKAVKTKRVWPLTYTALTQLLESSWPSGPESIQSNKSSTLFWGWRSAFCWAAEFQSLQWRQV